MASARAGISVSALAPYVRSQIRQRAGGLVLLALVIGCLTAGAQPIEGARRPSRTRDAGEGGAAGNAFGSALVFHAGLERFLDSPARDGWGWDLEVSLGGDSSFDEARADAERVADDSDVTAVTLAVIRDLEVGTDSFVSTFGTRDIEGDIALTVVDGHRPTAPNEVALGASTARDLHVGIGDSVTLPGEDGRDVRDRVVGIARFPVLEGDAPDDGMWLTLDGLQSLDEGSGGYPTMLVDLSTGANQQEAIDRLLRDHTFIGTVRRSTDATNLSQLSSLPMAVAALAGTLGAFALAHTLLVGVRRRSRELALLRTIGFTGRQVGSTIGWQATAVVAVSLVIGIPLGLVIGRVAWSALARSIGAADDPLIPVTVFWVIPVALVLANLIAAWPARAARRVRPAGVLRRIEVRLGDDHAPWHNLRGVPPT